VHGVAQLYTCEEPPCPQEAQIIRTDLAAIGIRVAIHTFPKPVMFTKINTPGEPYDVATVGWGMDYPDPSQYLTPLLDSSTLGQSNSLNFARFDDARFEARLHSAARRSGPERYLTFGALADAVARESSPLVVYSADQVRDFFSARVGCQVYQPAYGMDLANLCLRR
jgi:ABC-type oligopeptide transport system substrate-binding subunit